MKPGNLKYRLRRVRKNVESAYHVVIAAALLLTVSPAFGQLTKVNSTAQTIVTWAGGAVAVLVITVAFLYVGFKVLFRGQALVDLWHVLAGAVVIGGAAGFATFAMSS